MNDDIGQQIVKQLTTANEFLERIAVALEWHMENESNSDAFQRQQDQLEQVERDLARSNYLSSLPVGVATPT